MTAISGRLRRCLRKGLLLCVGLTTLVLLLSDRAWPQDGPPRGPSRGQGAPDPSYYGQDPEASATVLGALSSLWRATSGKVHQPHQHQQERRELFHVPVWRRLYLPAHFHLVDWHNDSALATSAKSSPYSDVNCTTTSTTPTFIVCLHPHDKDAFVSVALLTQGVWEPHITRLFQRALQSFPRAVVIDVGANIGFFTLLAAAMGHRVLAVEPKAQNARRLRMGVLLNNVQDKVVVLQNALSDTHRNVSLSSNPGNQGGIYVIENSLPMDVQTVTLDDLLSLMPSDVAIIKMDIEGYECRGLGASARFLKAVHVPYILMEWQEMYRHRYRAAASCPARLMRQMTDYLVGLGYVAHEVRTGVQMNPQRSATAWQVGDVYWRLYDQPLLVTPLWV